MLTNKRSGWWWHVKIYNYLTGKKVIFNSPKPFKTYDSCFKNMLKFLNNQQKKKSVPNGKKLFHHPV